MEHASVQELTPVATVSSSPPVGRADVRHERLTRWGALLDAHNSNVSLLSRVEYMDEEEVRSLRSDCSPLTVAFADPIFRGQGLSGDTYRDAVEFFSLTRDEAHHLLCDCHYLSRRPSSLIVAMRARQFAHRSKLVVAWQTFRAKVRNLFGLRQLR